MSARLLPFWPEVVRFVASLLFPVVPASGVSGVLSFHVNTAFIFYVVRVARVDADDHSGRSRQVAVDADIHIGAGGRIGFPIAKG